MTTCKEFTENTYVGGIWAKWSQKIPANLNILLYCEYMNKIFYTLWIAKTVFHQVMQNFHKWTKSSPDKWFKLKRGRTKQVSFYNAQKINKCRTKRPCGLVAIYLNTKKENEV